MIQNRLSTIDFSTFYRPRHLRVSVNSKGNFTYFTHQSQFDGMPMTSGSVWCDAGRLAGL